MVYIEIFMMMMIDDDDYKYIKAHLQNMLQNLI